MENNDKEKKGDWKIRKLESFKKKNIPNSKFD
jgi:hypothetical protein